MGLGSTLVHDIILPSELAHKFMTCTPLGPQYTNHMPEPSHIWPAIWKKKWKELMEVIRVTYNRVISMRLTVIFNMEYDYHRHFKLSFILSQFTKAETV